MLRARAHVRKAEFLEGTADRYLVEIDIEAFLDDASEVDASPPHHAIDGRIGSCFHDALQLLFLLGRQLRARAGSLAVDQPLGTPLVVPCAQSRNVCRSIAPISAAALRLIPSSTAASDNNRRA